MKICHSIFSRIYQKPNVAAMKPCIVGEHIVNSGSEIIGAKHVSGKNEYLCDFNLAESDCLFRMKF